MTIRQPSYSLGASEPEVARLDAQAETISVPTSLLLRRAGISPGMRVLDLGTGLGHIALLARALVGPTGAVVGIDQAEAMLAVADQRRVAARIDNVRFVQADVRSYVETKKFDAIVGRLILFHLPDAAEVLRHHINALRAGGLVVMVDFDAGATRTEPATALWNTVRGWILEAFKRAGAAPMVGARLGVLLREAGLTDVESLGLQKYFGPEDPGATEFLVGVSKSLAPLILRSGIATEGELGLDSLETRLTEDMRAHGAVGLIPTVVGAWGRRPSTV